MPVWPHDIADGEAIRTSDESAGTASLPEGGPPPLVDPNAANETLQQAWEIALAIDQRLAAQQWTASAAGEALQSARAQRWPTLTVEGSYTVRSDEPSLRFGLPGVPLPTDTFPLAQDENFAFRTRADLPLYTGGQIEQSIAAAAAGVSAAGLAIEGARNNLMLRVAEEYVAVLRAQRELGVSEINVRSLEAHANDVEQLFRHKQVPRNDLLAAQVALANACQRAIQAVNRLDGCRAAYNRRLGRPLDAVVAIAELPLETVEAGVDDLTARAHQRRPEIAQLAMEAASLRSKAAGLRAKNSPQFGLWGQYAFDENRFSAPEGIASVGVGLTCQVFDGGRNRHDAASVAQKAEVLMRLEADLESTIALQVRGAWRDIQETRRRLEVTSTALQRAEENLRVARKRYVAGMGISTEVLDAEALRTETQRNHDNAAYDAVMAVLHLRHATGDLTP